MRAIIVRGGPRLSGEVRVEGAKNSALKLMAAALLAPGASTITNVPDIADVDIMAEVLEGLGRVDLIADVIVDGVRQGLHRSRRQGFSTEFSDFKPYAPGDDLRRLDWRIYARTDRLFVKCFEAETSLELLLLLDATGSMAWRWENHISKLRYAAMAFKEGEEGIADPPFGFRVVAAGGEVLRRGQR